MCRETGKILWQDEGRAGAFTVSARWGRVNILSAIALIKSDIIVMHCLLDGSVFKLQPQLNHLYPCYVDAPCKVVVTQCEPNWEHLCH